MSDVTRTRCERVADEAGLSPEDLSTLHRTARTAAQCGAEILMAHYGQLSNIRSKGRQGDLVTEADEAAEAAVLQLLKETTPQIGILAEESGRFGADSGLQWMVDPLDGTTNFAHGYPFFATSIGLCWNARPLLGAIAVPFLHQVFHCCPGVGAFCNDDPIRISGCEELADSLLVTGFAYDRHTRLDNNYAEFCWLTHRTHGVRRGGQPLWTWPTWRLAFLMATGNVDSLHGILPPVLPSFSRLVEMSAITTAVRLICVRVACLLPIHPSKPRFRGS